MRRNGSFIGRRFGGDDDFNQPQFERDMSNFTNNEKYNPFASASPGFRVTNGSIKVPREPRSRGASFKNQRNSNVGVVNYAAFDPSALAAKFSLRRWGGGAIDNNYGQNSNTFIG